MHTWAARAALFGLIALRQGGIEPKVHPVDAAPGITALWEEPAHLDQRNLFLGAAAETAEPAARQPMHVTGLKTNGFSQGYDVLDAAGREWSVKLGDEAQTEVVASRLLWAIGYHQPPTFYVEHWTLEDGPSPGPQPPARFRPKDSHLKNEGVWSWQANPFVGTEPYRGLLASLLLLNSSDLKTDNNIVYRVGGRDSTETWYVVRDLGASLGATGTYRPRRNDIAAFEQEPFLVRKADGRTGFGFHGLQRELLAQVNGADLHWMAEHFGRLTAPQWRDAFRAAGYDEPTAQRYIAALRDRVATAAAIDDNFSGGASNYWMPRHLPALADAMKRVPHAFAFSH